MLASLAPRPVVCRIGIDEGAALRPAGFHRVSGRAGRRPWRVLWAPSSHKIGLVKWRCECVKKSTANPWEEINEVAVTVDHIGPCDWVGCACNGTQQSSGTRRSATAVPFNPGNGYGVGSLVSVCRPQCGFSNLVIGFAPPEVRKCVSKCIAAKKAAQH
jgi:hypothetical protein